MRVKFTINNFRKQGFLRRIYWGILKIFGVTPESKNLSYHKSQRRSKIEKYLSGHTVRKLQIGAQSNSIEGWLNVDIEPKEDHVVYMDATQKFPFPDQSMDYIFSEHMIEHISYEDAHFMLKECFRVLKPGGKIRIATPNLERLCEVVLNPNNPVNKTYIQHYSDRFQLPENPTFVLNKLFYSFHHKFLHTESTLKSLLENSGFQDFSMKEVNESNDENLLNIEQHWHELGEVPNRVETIVVEAVKNA